MVEEPDNFIIHMLREIRADIERVEGKVDKKADMADVRAEIQSLRADVASDIHQLDAKIDKTRKDVGDQIVGLRRAVMEYHSSVIGHGMLISDLEARMRRVEQHLDLPPVDAH